ncbi:HPr kinase/phosphorylase [Paenalcaligenes hominis]|uniref:HPr kinase/phosphorylase n=1 Tax=Paenalcaligenes hominis TaxID=643674 RepID=A0A1U9K1A0_9BURK|nr:HPr(Ser) kinase/phosphatase [Paenalcaligenes hominis]AQS51806.1 HPr kinase/phosphorylase [Paenalcaligenes hominis]NJB65006.1 HPr kinase/phosphorylase [Paenalcaligenes hominis]GGE57442.1 HPr kinase/phosphorylase [Paenalcaligenes hominis]
MLSIHELVNDNQARLDFQWLAGEQAALTIGLDAGMASADLIGHLNLIHPRRIQVLGVEELNYYHKFEPAKRQYYLSELIEGGVPALIVAGISQAPAELIAHCTQHNIPLLNTQHDAAELIDVLRVYLTKRLAPSTLMHGVFLDVLGLGVMITGESGLGKSELALELISRGHGLVADDAVELFRTAPHIIEGQCPPLIQNLLEVRGLGLLDIRTIFGETSVRRKMSLRLIVHLLRSNADNFERLPIQQQTQTVLGVEIRQVMLQVAAGRNLAVLVEAAVRNTILTIRGIDTMQEFMQRQALAMMENSPPSSSS